MSDSLRVSMEMQKMLGFVALGVKPKPAFGEEGQSVTKAGVPRWIVPVYVEESGETFEIAVASQAAPDVQRFQPVLFDGLTIGGSSRGLWWSATGAQKVLATSESAPKATAAVSRG